MNRRGRAYLVNKAAKLGSRPIVDEAGNRKEVSSVFHVHSPLPALSV